MARKRSASPSGTLVVLEHESRVLAGNPLGDPHVRKLAGLAATAIRRGRDARSRPPPAGALRPRRLHRLGDLAHELEALQRQCAGARSAAHPRAEDGAHHRRISRLLHLARGQSVRQFVRDRRLRRLPDAGNHPVRRSRIPHARLARPSRLLRQIVRGLRGDHPRHAIRAALGRRSRTIPEMPTSTSSITTTGRTR